jgi:hypothetical protein
MHEEEAAVCFVQPLELSQLLSLSSLTRYGLLIR